VTSRDSSQHPMSVGGQPSLRENARLWRGVEAQHVVSTMKLVDSEAEQVELEQILETSKPPAPAAHFLIATPFRYPSPRTDRHLHALPSVGSWERDRPERGALG